MGPQVSGPDNIMYFFVDDLQSFAPEAGSGFIDRIQVTTFPAAAVPGPIAGAGTKSERADALRVSSAAACSIAPELRIHRTASSTQRVGVGLRPARPTAIFPSGK